LAFTALLGVLAALPALSIDISAPTLPLLPHALGTSATVASLTLSLFMAGFALGQLSGGRLSDVRGRRPVLLAGLACYTLAGLACTASLSGHMLAAARFAQGLGAGACSVLSFAMVQDLFVGDAARAKRSYVTVVFAIVPMLAPAIGAFLSAQGGWRAVHAVLAAGGAVLLAIAALGVTESRLINAAASRTAGARAHERVRDDRQFVGITLANALSYGAIFAYIAGSPMVIIGIMHLSSAVFAAVFASTAAALTVGAWINGWLSRRGVPAGAILHPALAAAATAAIGLAAVSLADMTSSVLLVPLLLITMCSRGFIAPNMQHLAIERWPEQAGVASAAVGVSQLLSGAAASAVVGVLLPYFGAAAVTVPMALLTVLALLVWRRISR
jgi:DHA1 family bicyclomycin/chloramphenicol resistance-like MFS transporter